MKTYICARLIIVARLVNFKYWIIVYSQYGMLHNFKKRFPGGSAIMNPLAVQGTQEMSAGSLGGEDPLEEGMATRPSILDRQILWTEEPGWLWYMGLQRIRHKESDWACKHTRELCTTTDDLGDIFALYSGDHFTEYTIECTHTHKHAYI